jgi:hypothetical protein
MEKFGRTSQLEELLEYPLPLIAELHYDPIALDEYLKPMRTFSIL